MSVARGAPSFNSLMQNCVCWFTGLETTEFPILPSGVTVTPSGTFTKTDLGNNRQVLNFDGSTNAIDLSDNDAWACFDDSTGAVVCGWIKHAVFSTNRALVYQAQDGSNYWQILFNASLNRIYLYGVLAGVDKYNYYCSHTPTVGQWYHIAVVKSGSTCLIYVDGSPQSVTITTAFTGTSNNTGVFRLGASHNGQLKDVFVFKGRALSATEINLLMDRTHPITGLGLTPGGYDYWRDV
jgi:hypothetical protein